MHHNYLYHSEYSSLNSVIIYLSGIKMLCLMTLAFLDDPVLLVLIHCLYEAFYAKQFLIFNFFKKFGQKGEEKNGFNTL